MFFLVVDRLLNSSYTGHTRFTIVGVIGAICYILLHAYCYSMSGSANVYISKYRQYIVGIMFVEMITTGILGFLYGPKKIKHPKVSTNISVSENTNSKISTKKDKEEPKELTAKEKLELLKKLKNDEKEEPEKKEEETKEEKEEPEKKEEKEKTKEPEQILTVEETNEELKISDDDTEIPLYK